MEIYFCVEERLGQMIALRPLLLATNQPVRKILPPGSDQTTKSSLMLQTGISLHPTKGVQRPAIFTSAWQLQKPIRQRWSQI